jgi:hypothetical protein
MEYSIYLTLFLAVFAYVCITDPNVFDWINIKINHFIVDMQLKYIKLKWMFKKF